MTIEIEKELLERLISYASEAKHYFDEEGLFFHRDQAKDDIAAAESLIQSPDKNEEE